MFCLARPRQVLLPAPWVAGLGGLVLLSVAVAAAAPEAASGGEFRPVATRAVGADRVADRPNYVHSLTEIGRLHDWKALESVDWLDAGIHSRFRYEIRENDYRTPGLVSDDALVTQTLVYLGVRHAVDPLRFAGEFQDSRRLLSERVPGPNEVNYTEVLQAHADLHFENVVDGNPMTLMGGG